MHAKVCWTSSRSVSTQVRLMLTTLCSVGLLAGCKVDEPVSVPEGASTPAAPMPSATATTEPSPQPLRDLLRTASPPEVLSTLESPDERLQARVLVHACAPLEGEEEFALDEIVIEPRASAESWPASEQLQACGGLGAFGLELLYWSPNSRFLYFSTAREGVPDGCGFWQKPISVVDVQARRSRELGGGLLSPDGRTLAVWQAGDLVLWDLDHGEAGRFATLIDDVPPGPLAWAPDSSALAYLQVGGDCPPQETSHLVRLNLRTGESQELLSSASPAFGGLTWETPNVITLWDGDGDRWAYDLSGGILSPGS